MASFCCTYDIYSSVFYKKSLSSCCAIIICKKTNTQSCNVRQNRYALRFNAQRIYGILAPVSQTVKLEKTWADVQLIQSLTEAEIKIN